MGTKMSFVISRSADFWGEIDSNLDLIPKYKNGLIRLPTERRGPLLKEPDYIISHNQLIIFKYFF